MVAINLGRVDGGLIRCGSGHVAVVVTRGAGVRAACPECLSAAMRAVADREMTLSDYLARLEADDDLFAILDAVGLTPVALSPRGATELAAFDFPARTALLFGAEGPGLPDSVLNRARSVRIAMRGDFDSLNVATSAGIVLHAWVAGKKTASP